MLLCEPCRLLNVKELVEKNVLPLISITECPFCTYPACPHFQNVTMEILHGISDVLQVARGVPTFPKSVTKERILQNLDSTISFTDEDVSDE